MLPAAARDERECEASVQLYHLPIAALQMMGLPMVDMSGAPGTGSEAAPLSQRPKVSPRPSDGRRGAGAPKIYL